MCGLRWKSVASPEVVVMVAAVFELQIIDWVGSPYFVGPLRVLAGLKREAPDRRVPLVSSQSVGFSFPKSDG